MSLSQTYAATVRHQLEYFAVWEPGALLEIGDYGYLEGDIFKQKGNIRDLGIDWRERANPNESHKKFTSENDTKLDFGVGGQVTGGIAKASLKIQFGKEKSVFFNATGCTSVSIDNKDSAGEQLIALRKSGRWEREYVVVVEKVTAKNAQIIISQSGQAEITLEADSPAIQQIDLADVSLQLKVKNEKDIGYKFIGSQVVLLHSLWGLKRKWLLGDDDFSSRGDDLMMEETDELEFGKL